MANKSFVVQYLIKAREQYSTAAEKVRKSSDNMRKSVERTKKAFVASSAKATVLKNKIKANIPFFESLSAKATALKGKLASVSAGFGSLAAKAALLKDRLASPMVALNSHVARLKTTLKGVEDRFEGLSTVGTKLRNAGIAATAFLTLPIGLAANSLKNAARDAGETRSKFATVFAGMGPAAEKMANRLADGFGLAGTKSRELLGDTGDLLTGFGFTKKSALALAGQVNELAIDLASFTNFSGGAEGASKALNSALLGEREAMKSLGVSILEKDVLTKVSQMVAKGHRFESLRQAKAIATLTLATEQSKNAVGDYARTKEELANQERLTSARMQDMREAYGVILLPVMLRVTKAVRGATVWLTALSPGTKRVVLVVAALLAVLGPLLLVIGSIALAIPMLAAGFAIIAPIAAAAFWPVVVVLAALAASAAIIIAEWDKVSAFFGGFAAGFDEQFGPTATRLIERFKEAATIIAGLFSSDSEAAQNLTAFADIGKLLGSIIGGALDLIIRGLSGIGAIIGQVMAAIVTADFGQFDIEAIKAEFLGPQAQPMLTQSRVDVGVNVGLEAGLTQMGAASIAGAGVRRSDVGVTAQ